ncbi:hypothetical protein AB0758_30820 [Tolypothrix bouteillei VB521301_2]|uniref:hypothetical protein n=1 Tax=Tolypothrix bouteillei TaxID=1246981 RepID=UPI0038B6ABB0
MIHSPEAVAEAILWLSRASEADSVCWLPSSSAGTRWHISTPDDTSEIWMFPSTIGSPSRDSERITPSTASAGYGMHERGTHQAMD